MDGGGGGGVSKGIFQAAVVFAFYENVKVSNDLSVNIEKSHPDHRPRVWTQRSCRGSLMVR